MIAKIKIITNTNKNWIMRESHFLTLHSLGNNFVNNNVNSFLKLKVVSSSSCEKWYWNSLFLYGLGIYKNIKYNIFIIRINRIFQLILWN